MFKEISHFVRVGKEVSKLQKQHSRADFAELMMTRTDAQGFADVRRELVEDLTGRVLEIGCGTGTMFKYFSPKAQIEAIEPEQDFLELALKKATETNGHVHAHSGDGMKLDYPDGSFDAVVFGLVLCSVPSVEQVLAEAHRVLRVGGQLRALEHVRSEAAVPGFLMDMFNPLWMKINAQNCRLNRNPLKAIEAAGFTFDDVMAFKRFDTEFPAFPMRRIRAHKIASAA
jgi:ubiquinone/menaquinone biosynthesis C-methylase UbiE